MAGAFRMPPAIEEDPGGWAANTQSHLSKVSELRQEVRRNLTRSEYEASEADKAPNIGGPAMEDKLKRRYRSTQSLGTAVASKMECIQHSIFQIRQCVGDLQRALTTTRAAQSVVDLRLELREQRPPNELVDDCFSDALQQEQAVYWDSMRQLLEKLERGQELMRPLEEAKAEMQASRLTLHLDRSGSTQELLARIADLEKTGGQFCKDARQTLENADRRSKKALSKTSLSMRQKIAATLELKEAIEKDIKETRRCIADAELHLDRLQRQLEATLAMPERANNAGGDFCNKKLSAHTGVLAELRSKIKAAAYTGTHGRQLNVLFGRFDRDGSGLLDEDEVRRAMRRACKIPPQVVTDAEIASLCALLDEDKSGSVSISEIIDFLCADVNVDSLEQQCHSALLAIEKLKEAQKESQVDLRNKVAAWKIDVACGRVNPIKGMKLDNLPSPGRPTTASVPGKALTLPATPGRPVTAVQSALPGPASATWPQSSGRPLTSAVPLASTPRVGMGSPRKPKATAQPALPALTSREDRKPAASLDQAALNTFRSKIKAAAYSSGGKEFHTLFSGFDKDHSGQLTEDEVRQALRRTLKIPPAVISDNDISTLCSILDSDRSGSIIVDELVAFVGAEPTVSKRTGKPVPGTAPEPGGSSKVDDHDESAGPR